MMDIQRYRQAVTTVDIDALMTQFGPDPTVNVPSRREAFEGSDDVREILDVALRQFDDLDFIQEFANESGYVLQFTATIDGEDARGVNILRLVNDEIVELTVMVQPYAADHALRDRMIKVLNE